MSKLIQAGAVKVDFVAGSAQFVKESRRTMSRIDRFKRQAVRAARTIKRNWAAITTAVVGLTAALGVNMKAMTEYSATLVEASRSTGLAVKELEAMRSLFQGDGIGIKRTDKAFQEFSVRVGFAQRGIGQYTRAFEDLGIELRDSEGNFRSQADLFADVSQKLRETNSEAEAASIAYELFGRAGKEVIPILRRYGSEILKAAEHANRFRSVTEEQHVANKELDQDFTDLKENLSDFRDHVLSHFAEDLGQIVKNFNDWLVDLKENKSAVKEFADAVLAIADALATVAAMAVGGAAGARFGKFFGPKGAMLGAGVGAAAGWWLKEGLTEDLRRASLSGPEKALEDLDGQIGTLERQKNEDFDSWRDSDETKLQQRYAQRKVLQAMINAQAVAETPTAPAFTSTGTEDESKTEKKQQAKAQETAVEKMIRDGRRYLARMPDISWELMEPLTDLWLQEFYGGLLEAKTAKLNRTRFRLAETQSMTSLARMRGEIPEDDMRYVFPSPVMSANERERLERNAARRQATQRRRFELADAASFGSLNAVRGWQPKDDGFEARLAGSKAWWDTAEIDRIKERLEELSPLAKRLQQGFESFTDSLIDGFDNAGDAVKSLAKDLLKMAWRQTVTEPLSQALFGAGGFVAGLGIPGFAEGGRAHGLAMVGERGPELVDFSRPGMVYSNDRLRAAMGGGPPVHITYNIASTDGPGVKAALAQATPGIVSRAKASVAEDATRRGQFRSAVRGRR